MVFKCSVEIHRCCVPSTAPPLFRIQPFEHQKYMGLDQTILDPSESFSTPLVGVVLMGRISENKVVLVPGFNKIKEPPMTL